MTSTSSRKKASMFTKKRKLLDQIGKESLGKLEILKLVRVLVEAIDTITMPIIGNS